MWIRQRLDAHEVHTSDDLIPQPTVLVPDTTFWGRHYGVVVFRSWNLKRNIWWNEVESEKVAHYRYGRKILEERGWTFVAAVVDGRRGLATVFKDLPVQVCHFHQQKTVTKYLTRRPKTEAGVELRRLSFTLSRTTEKVFTRELLAWEKSGITSSTRKLECLEQSTGTTRTRMCAVRICRSNETCRICLRTKNILILIFRTPQTRLTGTLHP